MGTMQEDGAVKSKIETPVGAAVGPVTAVEPERSADASDCAEKSPVEVKPVEVVPPAPPQYVLRLDIPLDQSKALNDEDAKRIAKEFLDTLSNVPAIGVTGRSVKLQQVYPSAAPRKVELA